MSAPATPKVSRSHALPLIWVVPLLALAIAGWLGFSELHNRGPEIELEFAEAAGVEAGKTTLEYNGVVAGTVEQVKLKPALDGVVLRLRLRRSAAGLAAAGSRYWIVHPEIGFSGVRGLDTLVTGVRLNVRPGHGPKTDHFIGLDQTPPPELTSEGRSFILRSDRVGSLSTGAPVFYREFKVGQVESSWLAPDATAVLIRIHVLGPYVDLVRTNTRFWNAGGFNFKVSLLGAQLRDTSLESLITGGVGFATPDTGELAPVAESGAEFSVATDPEKEWLKWSPKIPVHSLEAGGEAKPKSGLLNELIK